MTTLLFTHPACLDHDPGRRHPENPRRLEAVLAALDGPEFAALERREAPRASLAQIGRMHPLDHVRAVLDAVPDSGYHHLDADTVVSPGSGEAALRAAGAVTAAVDAVLTGAATTAFCAVRPPGHHAEPERAMGFCLFNTIAIGAAQARAVHGLRRIAVVDFDVHHGNGTQAMFERDADYFYGSTHQSPLYPGSGAARERGVGNIVNAPLAPGAGSAAFRAAMENLILPALRDFAPELILISAGFDGHADDPLAGLLLTAEDFGWVTEQILAVAGETCAGRIVSTLEGGYDPHALAMSARAHVQALMKGTGLPEAGLAGEGSAA